MKSSIWTTHTHTHTHTHKEDEITIIFWSESTSQRCIKPVNQRLENNQHNHFRSNMKLQWNWRCSGYRYRAHRRHRRWSRCRRAGPMRCKEQCCRLPGTVLSRSGKCCSWRMSCGPSVGSLRGCRPPAWNSRPLTTSAASVRRSPTSPSNGSKLNWFHTHSAAGFFWDPFQILSDPSRSYEMVSGCGFRAKGSSEPLPFKLCYHSFPSCV